MRVRFLKGIASIFGTFEPDMVIDMPNEKIAASWVRNGIAEKVVHKHYYRKDGVCACGHVRKVRKVKRGKK